MYEDQVFKILTEVLLNKRGVLLNKRGVLLNKRGVTK